MFAGRKEGSGGRGRGGFEENRGGGEVAFRPARMLVCAHARAVCACTRVFARTCVRTHVGIRAYMCVRTLRPEANLRPHSCYRKRPRASTDYAPSPTPTLSPLFFSVFSP